MSERELHRAVAQATGETVREIHHRGFQPLNDDDLDDYRIDWEAVFAQRFADPFPQRKPRPAVA